MLRQVHCSLVVRERVGEGGWVFLFHVIKAELSLRAGGWGFPPASIRVISSYFHGKIVEKDNQKKFLASLFPNDLLYLPGNMKSS